MVFTLLMYPVRSVTVPLAGRIIIVFLLAPMPARISCYKAKPAPAPTGTDFIDTVLDVPVQYLPQRYYSTIMGHLATGVFFVPIFIPISKEVL